MSFKGQQDVPQDEGDGAEDDEWVSIRLEVKVGALATSLWCVSSGKTGVLPGNGDCWSIWKSGLKMKGLPGVN